MCEIKSSSGRIHYGQNDILCITNRRLCREDFLTRIERIAAAHPKAIVLREKDLTEAEYTELAREVLAICKKHGTPCILHTYIDAAMALGCKSIHLPLPVLRMMTPEDRSFLAEVGASCHSIEDAREAEDLGCTYITAGHVYDTDCKKGLPGRGITFLEAVCNAVSIPVYAIGGISAENIDEVRDAGAAGACVMSGLMVCEEPRELLDGIE